jgi:deoxyribodipyrimidine photo-lyase
MKAPKSGADKNKEFGMSPTIVWFRQDLRLADNPALRAACERGAPVIPLYIWAPEEEGDWPPGGASRFWLHHSLYSLDESLRRLGSRLVIRHGPTLPTLFDLIRGTGADGVFWNRRYEPPIVERDTRLKHSLMEAGVQAVSCKSALMFEPHEVRTGAGAPFKVFTPFWRQCLKQPEAQAPLPAPASMAAPGRWPDSLPLQTLRLEPRIRWGENIRRHWRIGEQGAQQRLHDFIADDVDRYTQMRDRPDIRGVSRLSPFLHFGELSPRQVWTAVSRREQAAGRMTVSAAAAGFLRQLIWREFAHHLLVHFPATGTQPLRQQFAAFPWHDNAAALKRWERGQTGYPIVDAGMRELWTIGWMHNRVRMIVASFLVKDLLVHWLHGARWFWDTLVDADLANNTLGWQWTAGCGADAAPYFRIFNPVTQARRFDPDGAYVRKWVPELAQLPTAHLHAPWHAPAEVLGRSGVRLGVDYPKPLLDHDEARQRALAAWNTMRRGESS